MKKFLVRGIQFDCFLSFAFIYFDIMRWVFAALRELWEFLLIRRKEIRRRRSLKEWYLVKHFSTIYFPLYRARCRKRRNHSSERKKKRFCELPPIVMMDDVASLRFKCFFHFREKKAFKKNINLLNKTTDLVSTWLSLSARNTHITIDMKVAAKALDYNKKKNGET